MSQAQQQEEDSNKKKKKQQEAEYRRNCRQFYRQSTSFVSDNSEDDDEDDAAIRHHHHPSSSSSTTLVVVEAVDRLTEGSDSYKSFLSALQQQQQQQQQQSQQQQQQQHDPVVLQRLTACGLPTDEDAIARTLHNADALERLIAIRTEERKLAHERNVQERIERVQRLLRQSSSSSVKKERSSVNGSITTTELMTTHQNIRCIQQTVQRFVAQYASSFVASHPLIAGMRRLVETQLDHGTPVVAWTLDAAVISEAVVAQEQGAHDTYIQDAVTALTSFLVWINNHSTSNKEDENNQNVKQDNSSSSHDNGTNSSNYSNSSNNNNNTVLIFAINSSFSDRTLDQILQVLPPFSELHARPTGNVHRLHQQDGYSSWMMNRINVDGDFDEPMDLCAMLTRYALPWRR